MRYNFILRNEVNYPVEKMCKCMKVSEMPIIIGLKVNVLLAQNQQK